MAIYFLGAQQTTGTSGNPTVVSPITESNTATVKVNASATSVQLMTARSSRKSLHFHNDSNKACFISTNGLAATTNTSATPNFKYWLPSQFAMQVNSSIPITALNVIFEADATGAIITKDFKGFN